MYLFATSGSPDAGAHTNTGIGLMAGLGQCPATGTLALQVPFVTINEVSTIAMAYALAGFATDATHISSSGTALAQTGVANTMANVANILDVASGTALTATAATGSTGMVPQSTMNTLGNILAACVNTTSASSSNSATLFVGAATSDSTASGTRSADTATAAINIAHFPGANISALYGLAAATAPFAPALSAQPNDFTLGLTFTGGGLNSPFNLAIDGSGSVWVANFGGNSLSEFSSVGAALSGSSGYTGGGLSEPQGVAIDGSGNVWVANSGGNSLSKFSSTGTAISGSSGYTGGGLNSIRSMAIDGSGNAWAANQFGNSLTELLGAATPVITPICAALPATPTSDGSSNLGTRP